MKENKLLNVYGARLSKSGKHINIVLVDGEGENKQFYTASVVIGESKKAHGNIFNSLAVIEIPLLQDPKPKNVVYDSDVPF